jgi:hypothetical protein
MRYCVSEVDYGRGKMKALGAYIYMCIPSGNGSSTGCNKKHRVVGDLSSWWNRIVGLDVTRDHKIIGPCDVDRLTTLMVMLSPCCSSVGPPALS